MHYKYFGIYMHNWPKLAHFLYILSGGRTTEDKKMVPILVVATMIITVLIGAAEKFRPANQL